MRKLDHIALQVEEPRKAAEWYCENFGAEALYVDDTWAFVQLQNIKLAFVIKGQHPPHIAFEVNDFSEGDVVKSHRDGTSSAYKRDPFGNIYELIKYPKKS
jgi:catechol 2,3-dioxygenase-like lactoylglutathione lyase family enzyme|tara:strand:- start:285 stop:587 length:303 start_codon:yes stop_codon:yes gene_type:complete